MVQSQGAKDSGRTLTMTCEALTPLKAALAGWLGAVPCLTHHESPFPQYVTSVHSLSLDLPSFGYHFVNRFVPTVISRLGCPSLFHYVDFLFLDVWFSSFLFSYCLFTYLFIHVFVALL